MSVTRDPIFNWVNLISSEDPARSLWYVDDHTTQIIVTIANCIIAEILGFFGIIGNVLNAIVFWKQGFHDTVNISLFGLAIADLGSLLTLQWHNICLIPSLPLPFNAMDIGYITAGWPHICFTRITGLITAYITLERCLCIALPLKVKIILTPRRTSFIIVSFFIILFASTSPIFTVNSLTWAFSPERNRSILGLSHQSNRAEIERITLAFNNAYGYVTFIATSVLTAVLVTGLNSKAKWRQTSTATSNNASFSSRDRKVIKMVVGVSVIFIICLFPTTVMFLGTMVRPEFGTAGEFRNLNYLLVLLFYVLETVNSSVNIFIYINMSTKYRLVFEETFCGRKNGDIKKLTCWY